MSRLDVSTIDSFIICSYAGGTRAARVRYLAGYRRAATTSLAETFFGRGGRKSAIEPGVGRYPGGPPRLHQPQSAEPRPTAGLLHAS